MLKSPFSWKESPTAMPILAKTMKLKGAINIERYSFASMPPSKTLTKNMVIKA